MIKGRWDWDYMSAYVDSDGSITWSSLEKRASVRQSGQDFLAKGLPDKLPGSAPPAGVRREIAHAVHAWLQQSKAK